MKLFFLENESSNDIYVIKSGTVKLFTLAREQELIIDILGPGEIFGEMAFIDQNQRMASAVTDSESVLMRFTKETLFENAGDAILQKIFESLARRIWFSHQRLVILRIADPVTRLYAFVYNLIRDHEIKNKSWKKPEQEYCFQLSLAELKKMCGLSKLNDSKIDVFLNDRNLKIASDTIIVHNRKRIEEKVAYYKTRLGQISSNLA